MIASAETAASVIDEAGDGLVALRLWRVFEAGEADWPVPWYAFTILAGGAEAGGIRLRVGGIDVLRLFAGHIGCNVDEGFRGRQVAARATRLILPLAAAHGISPVWLTCNPGNIASMKTFDRLGAVFVEEVATPPDYGEPNAPRKRRYRLDLSPPPARGTGA